jgi:hypothetical protein
MPESPDKRRLRQICLDVRYNKMKKINQNIIGFVNPPILKQGINKIQKFDWFCNALKPLNTESIPDQIEEEFHEISKRKLVVSIFKDTSDKNEDSSGNKLKFEHFMESPKTQNIHEFNIDGKRIKTSIIRNGQEESYTNYKLDQNGNLILLEYNRLGYVQYKNEYEYDDYGNIIKLKHFKDISHGNEEFEQETESHFSYLFDESKIIRNTFKYVNQERIQRGIEEYTYKESDQILNVKIVLKHLRTQSEITYFKKYDQMDNLIESYARENERYLSNSFQYKFEYDKHFNWINRKRSTMNNLLTLNTQRNIDYK